MLDIQYIRKNQSIVEERAAQKGYQVDIGQLLVVDEKRRNLQIKVDELRRQRNSLSAAAKGEKPTEEDLTKGRELKRQLVLIDEQLKQVDADYLVLLKTVPNMPLDMVPVGLSEDENKVVKTVGALPEFSFSPLSHHELGEASSYIDKVRAAKISGSRFAYLRGDLVRLQFAIIDWVMSVLIDEKLIAKLIADNDLNLVSKAFVPIVPPAMLKTQPYLASSRLNAEEVTYKIEQDDLWLNASAEHTLCTMYMDEVLEEKDLPLRMLGYSTSFRREAGTYGKDMEGILRLHQFDKLEMEVLSSPETGLDEHKLLVAIQEYLVSQLGLTYQLLEKCTADIGKPNAKGMDINTWFPGQNAYRETHTADYMTDFQSRDLKIRLRRENSELVLIHTNDATAFALGRIMAAIMENNQTNEGKINIPDVLRPYFGQQEQI
jgi:seryl-tRNA synthetase